jgi:hypothetical protein
MTTEIEPTNLRKERAAMADHPTPAKAEILEALDKLPAAQRERAVRIASATRESTAAPPMKLSMKGNTLEVGYSLDPALAMALQMADMGTTDQDFHRGIIHQIASIGSQGNRVDSGNSNFIFAVVRSVEPRDELEAMLATQMGAIHAATMMLARRLNHVDNITQQDAAERALNKLARTFSTQMEALKRYRTSGQQKVTVEHVTVNAGGQAIVGAVTK